MTGIVLRDAHNAEKWMRFGSTMLIVSPFGCVPDAANKSHFLDDGLKSIQPFSRKDDR
ncbi:MAG TPA: hypothetical protein VGF97_11695 [Rhizomicrobium sp.]|jgi:hypothetical protein